jgi:hypothetical protein
VAAATGVRPPHLNISHPNATGAVALIQQVLAHKVLVNDLAELEAVFAGLDQLTVGTPATLDLIGHSSSRYGCLLVLGTAVIDAADPRVATLFMRHAATIKTHANELRLLGCNTARDPRGRATLATLSSILGIRVRGAIEPICEVYFDADGLKKAYENRIADARWRPPRPPFTAPGRRGHI